MPFTPRVRAFLLILVLAFAAGAAGLMVLGRNQSTSEAAPPPARHATPKPHAPRPAGSAATSTRGGTFTWVFSPGVFHGKHLPAQSTWTQADKPLFLKHLGARGLTYAQWRAKHESPAPTPISSKPVPQPAASPGEVLPAAIRKAFAAHRTVVVSLYDPSATVDNTAMLEAAAGAKVAGTAFVSIDVTKHEVDSLNARYGVIEDPAVLVLRPSGEIAFRVDGFADRDTVAQAATNAKS
jgi:hypothetical protein